MNYDELTEEQREALKLRPRKVSVYESDYVVMDETTGQILRQERKTVSKTSEEPDFIKVYYKTMLAFADAEGIPLDFVMALSSFISFTNGESMFFKNDRMTRERIYETCRIKESMYKRYLRRCVDCGLLMPTEYRGTYEVNPFFIAKGRWDSIKQLQLSFDFVSGKWIRKVSAPLSVDLVEPMPLPQVDEEAKYGEVDE